MPSFKRVLGDPLHVEVERELHVVAGRGLLLARLTHEPTPAVDFEATLARTALQLRLEELLDPLLPDEVVGRVVLALADLVLLLVDRRDVAEEVRGHRVAVVEARRVLTDALALRLHPREQLRVLEDVRQRLVASPSARSAPARTPSTSGCRARLRSTRA